MSVEIVCEIGNSHGGDLRRAIRLIDAAKAAGVDTIKLQCYTAQELVDLRGNGPAPEPWGSQGWTMRTLYEKAATPHHWFPVLASYCEGIGMPWFSSVFGRESLDMLEFLHCPRYKLAALDYDRDDLRAMVRATGKPLVISTNRPDAAAGDAAEGSGDTYCWCPKGYPQRDMHLRVIRRWRFDGFSYHGKDFYVPVYAVAAGARLVEFHFHLEAEPNELEANVCLNEWQTEAMVREIREVEGLL